MILANDWQADGLNVFEKRKSTLYSLTLSNSFGVWDQMLEWSPLSNETIGMRSINSHSKRSINIA